MRKPVLILTALAGQLLAGSFFLTLGNPALIENPMDGPF